MFDGLFSHQLFLLVPLHAAHHAGPDDADHGLLREAGLLHLLFGEGNNLSRQHTSQTRGGPPKHTHTPSPTGHTHLLLRLPAGHHVLELLLQLLAGADGLLVARKVGQLLQPGVGEVFRKMLTAPFVGRKELLRAKAELARRLAGETRPQCRRYHQPVVHAHFTEADRDRVDVLLVDPGLE